MVLTDLQLWIFRTMLTNIGCDIMLLCVIIASSQMTDETMGNIHMFETCWIEILSKQVYIIMLNTIVMTLNMVCICDDDAVLFYLRVRRCRMFFSDRRNDERNRNDKKKSKRLHCFMTNDDDHSIF